MAAANLIALPLSYFLMSGCLRDFAYRMTLGWSVFALTAVLSLGLGPADRRLAGAAGGPRQSGAVAPV